MRKIRVALSALRQNEYLILDCIYGIAWRYENGLDTSRIYIWRIYIYFHI